MKALSASRIKTLENCSWLYWCNYHLRLPKVENDGAKKGTICHEIFELLLHPKHKGSYDKAITNNSIVTVKPIYRLIRKLMKKFGFDPLDKELTAQLDNMILVGLKTDFFVQGGTVVKPEYQFEIMNVGPKYYIKGFIDKPAIRGTEVVIDDFKSSKKQFSGEDKESNMQALIYSLAARKIWPDFKPTVRFIFLQFPDDPIQQVTYEEDVLKGFEEYLAHIQQIVDKFDEDKAREHFAADHKAPSTGEFKGQLLCGFAKKKGQLKKDGNKMWHCDYKFPFDYWVVKDANGGIVSTAFDKNKLKLKTGETIEEAHYQGCPKFNYTTMDNLTPTVTDKKQFSNCLDDF